MKNNNNTFEKLEVWKHAHQLTLKIYKLTKNFPKDEHFRLVDQLCRAISSVAANIVEGNARSSKKEYRQFVYQAKGSLQETKYHLLLAKDLGYISNEVYRDLIDQADTVGVLISGLLKYLNSKI